MWPNPKVNEKIGHNNKVKMNWTRNSNSMKLIIRVLTSFPEPADKDLCRHEPSESWREALQGLAEQLPSSYSSSTILASTCREGENKIPLGLHCTVLLYWFCKIFIYLCNLFYWAFMSLIPSRRYCTVLEVYSLFFLKLKNTQKGEAKWE